MKTFRRYTCMNFAIDSNNLISKSWAKTKVLCKIDSCYDSNDKYIIGSHIVFVLFDWPLYIMFTLVFFHRMNELSRKYKQLQKDKESADHTINKLSKTVQERDEEIDSLVEEVAMWELYTVNATHVYILHTTINANWEG